MAVPAIPEAGKPWLTWAQGVDAEARKVADKADATDPRLTDARTPTDSSVTNAKVAANAAISADKLVDGTAGKVLTAAERTKLAGIATGATANSTDATLLARANHTGTQSADTLTDGTTNKAFLATERTKLTGVATGATANSPDATLLARANHTGTQAATTITGLATVATSGSYADLTGKPTIPAAYSDAQAIAASTASGAFITIVTGLASGAGAVTANTTAIQAGIDAAGAADGGTVIIPRGTWVVSPLKLRTRVRLIGLGFGSRLQLAAGANTHMISLFDVNTEQTQIEDLWLDGNKAAQTAGDVVRYDNTGYNNGAAFPSLGDPNHFMRRVSIVNAKGSGVSFAGDYQQSQLDAVLVSDCDSYSFNITAPDIHLISCVSRRSGLDGFFIAGNSVRLMNCKAFLAGRLDATNGSGFRVANVSRADLTHCEAQDNRQHGYSLSNTAQSSLNGCKADRNGLGPEPVTGFGGDGMFAAGVTASRIDVTAGDRNSGTLMQRWAYNCGAGNAGNIVTLAVGATASGTYGNGSWGTNSSVTITQGGQTIAQQSPPLPATTQTGTAYTLSLADAGTVVESNNAAAVTITVPTDAAVAFPIGTVIEVHQIGAGQVTIAGAGVNLRSRGAALKLNAQYAVASLRKRAANEWIVAGDVTT